MPEIAPEVLVIDDSEIAVDGMLQILASASIPAIGMPSAIGATRAVLRHRIRVVVADVNMPVLAGNSLVALFKNNPKLVDVKVVLVSGLPKDDLVRMAKACGADSVVAKDEISHKLVVSVRRLLQRQAGKPGRP